MTALCPHCKYPRRGLGDDAPCPECGRHPGERHPPLAEEPAEHRRRLARGARLACVSVGIRFAHTLALILAAALARDALLAVLWIGLMPAALANALAGFLLTGRGRSPARNVAGLSLRSAASIELIAAFVGGGVLLADAITWLEWALPIVLAAAWAARSVAMVFIMSSLARRLRSDRLERQLRGWLKYAGIAAMTPIIAVVAAALTALIPILAPITIIAAVPFAVFVGVLGAIAIAGSIALHLRLTTELRQAI